MALRVSKTGLESMKKQLENLRNELSDLRIFKGSVAIHSGDAWHDNNDFEQCEIEERRLEQQIINPETSINTAIIMDDTISDTNVVNYGARVTIKLTCNNEDFPVDTIRFSDSNIDFSDLTCVSANSPLGKVIYQEQVGFIGHYNVGSNIFKVEILNIEY